MTSLTQRMAGGQEIVIEVEQAYQEVRSMVGEQVVAKDWTFTDNAGHEHDATLASTKVTEENVGWCETCGDMHGDFVRRCRECGEEVHPRYEFREPKPVHVPGLMTGTLTVRDGAWQRRFLLTADHINSFRWGQDGIVNPEWVEAVKGDALLLEETIFW